MLVKKSIVEKWYQTDSWVYKNFSYLFQNPLWQKRIPRGFSVCPYFWLSLFSILFRFCFVAPIQYIVMPIVKAIGKPAKVVDNLCKKVLAKIGFDEEKLDETPTGFNIFLGVLAWAALAFIGILIAFIGVKLVALYVFLKGIALGMFAYWSGLTFVTMWTTLFIHKLATDTECKTMNYLWVWLVLFFLAAGIFIPTELIHGTTVLFTTIGQVLWAALCIIGTSLSVSAAWLGGAFVWLAKVIWSGVWWKPMAALVIPWWGFIALLCVVGWLFDKFCNWAEKRNTQVLFETNPAELHARYRSAWISLFTRVLTVANHWKHGECFDSDYKGQACKALSYSLFCETFEVMWKDKLDKLQTRYPGLSNLEWKKMVDYNGTSDRFAHLYLCVDGQYPEGTFDFNMNDFARTMTELIKSPQFKGEIEALTKEYIRMAQQCEQRKLNKKQSWSHLTCLKVTSAIGEGACSVGRGLVKGGKLVGAFFGQVKTLTAYLWMLAKAKKQGACPYFTFTEVNKTPTKKA